LACGWPATPSLEKKIARSWNALAFRMITGLVAPTSFPLD
jgi:hypothetical protein